jgi:hypothetical protein
MVWDTREVRETASCTQHNANISPFDTIPHSSTSLASKSEPEVDLYGIPTSSTSLAGKSELEVHLYDVLAQLPTPTSSSILAGERSHLLHKQQMTC